MRVGIQSVPSYRSSGYSRLSATGVPRQSGSIIRTTGPASILNIAMAITILSRREIAALVECLIELLNRADVDPDLEDTHDQEWIDECEPEEFF